jgi:hypothetical protein
MHASVNTSNYNLYHIQCVSCCNDLGRPQAVDKGDSLQTCWVVLELAVGQVANNPPVYKETSMLRLRTCALL